MFIFIRHRSTPMFESADLQPVSSSSEKCNIQLQGFQKTYNQQQPVFLQQQPGDDSLLTVLQGKKKHALT